MFNLLLPATLETLYMVGVSTLFTVLLGLPLGILLTLIGRGHLLSCPPVYEALSWLVNIMRSLPFIILMIFIMPFTRLVIGTAIGTNAATLPLIIAAVPFFARLTEGALREVDDGVVEAAVAMGASTPQIVVGVMLREALPSLILSATTTTINLIGYSAMAGAVGGGGIGDLAIRYGYHRFRLDIMFATLVILVVLVQVVQSSGHYVSHLTLKNRRK
ncbi:methionine ABC transporter permease [Fusibacter sp. JL298sf-3]